MANPIKPYAIQLLQQLRGEIEAAGDGAQASVDIAEVVAVKPKLILQPLDGEQTYDTDDLLWNISPKGLKKNDLVTVGRDPSGHVIVFGRPDELSPNPTEHPAGAKMQKQLQKIRVETESWKGQKYSVADLPRTENKDGDVRLVTSEWTLYVWKDDREAWEPLTSGAGGGGASNLDGLTDVTLTSPATSQYLKYNGTEWVNATPVQSDVSGLVAALAGKAAATHTHAQSDVTNLVSDLALKAPLASPALTGTPTAPTATAGTSTLQIATTAFVSAAFAAGSYLLNGVTAPTSGVGDDGDFYVDTAAHLLYGPKASGDWGLAGGHVTYPLTLSGNMTLDDNETVRKSSGGNAFDGAAYSATGWTADAYATATCGTGASAVFFALSTNPSASAGYADMDYAIHFYGGAYYIYESNVVVAGPAACPANSVGLITFDGTNVVYKINGATVHTTARAVGAALHFDSCCYAVGDSLTGISYGPLALLGASSGAIELGIPTGGTTGQFLRKASGTDFDAGFADIAQSEVTGLVSTLALKAPLASPALSGTPTAPTATAGTSTTQLATTAFVSTAVDAYIPKSLASGNVLYGVAGVATAGTPDAAGLVDKTSTQTISGAKTFSSGVTLTGSAPGFDGTPSAIISSFAIQAARSSAATTGFLTGVTGDSFPRFQVLAGGDIQLGGGAAAPDWTLARTGANVAAIGSGDTLDATAGTLRAPTVAITDNSTKVATTQAVTTALAGYSLTSHTHAFSAITGQIGAGQYGAGTIVNADISASAAIALSKLAVDPLARANHTGTQLASTISDFNTAADARITAQKGVASGLATLDGGGKVPASQLPSSLMEYQGNWNASTNSPALADGTAANAGNVYRVSVAGTQNLGSGAITFDVGDYAVCNASGVWEKSDTTDAVASYNGRTGAVVPASGDYTVGMVTGAAPLASPTFTGTPTAPTVAIGAGTNIATIGAVSTALGAYLPKAGGTVTGTLTSYSGGAYTTNLYSYGLEILDTASNAQMAIYGVDLISFGSTSGPDWQMSRTGPNEVTIAAGDVLRMPTVPVSDNSTKLATTQAVFSALSSYLTPAQATTLIEDATEDLADIYHNHDGRYSLLGHTHAFSTITGSVGAGQYGAGSIVNADISGSAAIAFTKLASMTNGNVLYGAGGAVTQGTPDTAGLMDKASAQTITGVKDFTANGIKVSTVAPTSSMSGTLQFAASGSMVRSQRREAQRAVAAKTPVRVAITANVALTGWTNPSTFDGISIAGFNTSGEPDEMVQVTPANRVLLTGQTNPAENGVYYLEFAGLSYELTRPSDANSWESVAGSIVTVMSGTHANTLWMSTSAATGTLGTTAISFIKQGGTVAASAVTNTPAGNIAATNVQAALNELDTEKLALTGGTLTGSLAVQHLTSRYLIGNGGFNFFTAIADSQPSSILKSSGISLGPGGTTGVNWGLTWTATDEATINAGDVLRMDTVPISDNSTKLATTAAVTTALGSYLLKSGGTMTGAIAMGGNKITGLAAGTTAGDSLRYEQLFTSGTLALSGNVSGLVYTALGSPEKTVTSGTGVSVWRNASDAQPVITLDGSFGASGASISLGGGGAGATDWKLTRTAANEATIASGDVLRMDTVAISDNSTKLATTAAVFSALGSYLTTAAASSTYLPLAGGTMSGAIAMGTNKVTGLSAATAAGDALRYEQLFTSGTLSLLGSLTLPVSTSVSVGGAATVGYGYFETSSGGIKSLLDTSALYFGTSVSYDWYMSRTAANEVTIAAGDVLRMDTVAISDNSTKLATTAAVFSALGSYLPLAGGTMTGDLTVATAGGAAITAQSTGYATIQAMPGGSFTSTILALGSGGSTNSSLQMQASLNSSPRLQFWRSGTAISLDGTSAGVIQVSAGGDLRRPAGEDGTHADSVVRKAQMDAAISASGGLTPAAALSLIEDATEDLADIYHNHDNRYKRTVVQTTAPSDPGVIWIDPSDDAGFSDIRVVEDAIEEFADIYHNHDNRYLRVFDGSTDYSLANKSINGAVVSNGSIVSINPTDNTYTAVSSYLGLYMGDLDTPGLPDWYLSRTTAGVATLSTGAKIRDTSDPIDANDLARKSYVDAAVAAGGGGGGGGDATSDFAFFMGLM